MLWSWKWFESLNVERILILIRGSKAEKFRRMWNGKEGKCNCDKSFVTRAKYVKKYFGQIVFLILREKAWKVFGRRTAGPPKETEVCFKVESHRKVCPTRGSLSNFFIVFHFLSGLPFLFRKCEKCEKLTSRREKSGKFFTQIIFFSVRPSARPSRWTAIGFNFADHNILCNVSNRWKFLIFYTFLNISTERKLCEYSIFVIEHLCRAFHQNFCRLSLSMRNIFLWFIDRHLSIDVSLFLCRVQNWKIHEFSWLILRFDQPILHPLIILPFLFSSNLDSRPINEQK